MKTMLELIIEDRDAWKARAARALEDCDRLKAALENARDTLWAIESMLDKGPDSISTAATHAEVAAFEADAALSAVRRDEVKSNG